MADATRVVNISNRPVNRTITVGANQNLIVYVNVQPGTAAKATIRVVLSEPGATCQIIGGALLRARQRLELTLDTIHRAPNTKGSTLFKVILKDHARLEFSGMIKIAPAAQGSVDFLRQDSLLLSPGAVSNAIPGLEIEANDVKASHAATAAPLNPEHLFYLRSRGIPIGPATAMISRAFLAPALDSAPLAISSAIYQRMRI